MGRLPKSTAKGLGFGILDLVLTPVSRDLDFDDGPDVPDLQQGSNVGHGAGHGPGAGASTSYEGSGGMSFDDDFDDAPQGSLELDVPPPPPPPGPPSQPNPQMSGAPPPIASSRPSDRMPVAPPSSSRNPGALTSGAPPGPQSSGQHVAASAAPAAIPVAGPPPPPEPPSPAAMIAKYPPPPPKPLEAPVYFFRVVLRQWELRQDLTALRRRRSPDVRLYEAALDTYDKKTFAIGLAMTSFGLLVALGLFLIPVWKRFFFND